jgi:monoamine oxidase
LLARDFAQADASGKSVREVQAARFRRRSSRREFLRGSGIAVAAASFPAWAGQAVPKAAPRIAIVGGGIAGLTAALTLQDAGFFATIYEASGRAGGRMHSDTTTWQNGQVTEHCGELIDPSHDTILDLAKRFKIPVVDVSRAEPPQSTETYYFFGQRYPRDQAIEDFKPVYQAVKQDLNAAGYPTLYSNATRAAEVLDQMSLFEWIDQRVPGGHDSAMGQLLDIAYSLEYGGESTEQSSLNLIYLLGYQPIRAFERSAEQYHMTGGNEGLPRAIAAALPAGSIRLNTALTAIARNEDRTFTLSFLGGGQSSTVIADRVILTLPFSVLRRLDYRAAGFNATKTIAIQELGYGTNVKLHTQFRTRLWNRRGPWGIGNGSSFADTGYQHTWDVTRAQGKDTGILVSYTGGNIGASFTGDLDDPETIQNYARQFLRQLEPAFPGITAEWNGLATLDVPARVPTLLGSYAYWKPGQYTRFAGAERERSGNCHFAGEHCSIDFQGYMEGGAQEGARAANEILADIKAGVV